MRRSDPCPRLSAARLASDGFSGPGACGRAFQCHILEHEDNDMMRPYEVLG